MLSTQADSRYKKKTEKSEWSTDLDNIIIKNYNLNN